MDQSVSSESARILLPDGPGQLESLIALWEEVDDETFDEHYRQRYFGEQKIDRLQALSICREFHQQLQLDLDLVIVAAVSMETVKAAENHFPEFVLAVDVIRPGFPLAGILASLLTHTLIVLLIIIWGPLFSHYESALFLENHQVVFYKLSEGFPDISPPLEHKGSTPLIAPRDRIKRHRDVSIHRAQKESSLVIEQAKMKPLQQLPRMELPNIFLAQPEIARPAAPTKEQLLAEEMKSFVAKSTQEPLWERKERVPARGADLSRYFDSPKGLPAPLMKIPQAAASLDVPTRSLSPSPFHLGAKQETPPPFMRVPEMTSMQPSVPLSKSETYWPSAAGPAAPLPQLGVPEVSANSAQLMLLRTPNPWQLQADRAIPMPLMSVGDSPGTVSLIPLSVAASPPVVAFGRNLPLPQLLVPESPTVQPQTSLAQAPASLPIAAGRTAPVPMLALPDAPTETGSGVRSMNQLAVDINSLNKANAPAPVPQLAIPAVEMVETKVQAADISRKNSASLLVYSTQPRLPAPNLTVPSISLPGSILSATSAGPEKAGQGGVSAPSPAAFLPDVFIQDHLPAPVVREGLPIVENPKPLPTSPPETQLAASIPPQSATPSLPLKLPESSGLVMNLHLPASPLTRLERRGGKVYSANLMAPNFSSRRGVWYFRFARLDSRFGQKSEGLESLPEDQFPVSAPSVVVQVDPRYPPEIIREKIEGMVTLYAVIRKEGTVDGASVIVLQQLDSRLDAYACEALRQWKFKPSLQNGVPIDIQAEISIPFYFRPASLVRAR